MLKKILLATDFTSGSLAAQAHCQAIARAFDAKVLVHHAIETLEAGADEDDTLESFYESLRVAAEEKVGRIVDEFKAGGIDASGQVTLGRRWNEIITTAHQEAVELIIVGSREPASTPPDLVGTTSHKVFLTSRVPVLVVRSEGTSRG